MMSIATDTPATTVQAVEAAHVLQTYKRQPVVFVRGEGVWLVADDGTPLPRHAVGHWRQRARARASGAGCRRAGAGRRTRAHVEPVLPPVPGSARGAPHEGVGSRARVLLQQRRGSRRGMPQVRAPVLVHRGHAAARSSSRSNAASRAARWARCRRRGTSTTGRPSDRSCPRCASSPTRTRTTCSRPRSDQTAAIIAEPIQGEGGVRPLPPQIVAAINKACADTGALYIADEVQSGLGRTGHMFHFEALGLRPDLISVGKALGAGVPIGAVLVSSRVAASISAGDHGTTYGGNPLACRAALAVLDTLEQWSARSRPPRRSDLRRPAAGTCPQAPDGGGGARRRPDAGPRPRPRRHGRRTRRPRARPRSSIARQNAWCACCRRT